MIAYHCHNCACEIATTYTQIEDRIYCPVCASTLFCQPEDIENPYLNPDHHKEWELFLRGFDEIQARTREQILRKLFNIQR